MLLPPFFSVAFFFWFRVKRLDCLAGMCVSDYQKCIDNPRLGAVFSRCDLVLKIQIQSIYNNSLKVPQVYCERLL